VCVREREGGSHAKLNPKPLKKGQRRKLPALFSSIRRTYSKGPAASDMPPLRPVDRRHDQRTALDADCGLHGRTLCVWRRGVGKGQGPGRGRGCEHMPLPMCTPTQEHGSARDRWPIALRRERRGARRMGTAWSKGGESTWKIIPLRASRWAPMASTRGHSLGFSTGTRARRRRFTPRFDLLLSQSPLEKPGRLETSAA